MTTVFADTFYFLALLDSREATVRQASQFSRDSSVQIVTTDWVLAEFGNAYSDPRDRADFVHLLASKGLNLQDHTFSRNRRFSDRMAHRPSVSFEIPNWNLKKYWPRTIFLPQALTPLPVAHGVFRHWQDDDGLTHADADESKRAGELLQWRQLCQRHDPRPT